VAGQDADVTLDRLGDDVGRLSRPHHAIGTDHLDLHRLGHTQPSRSQDTPVVTSCAVGAASIESAFLLQL
jgi:hypothetical protein